MALRLQPRAPAMDSARRSEIASPELFVVAVKQQVAIVRTLADELERFLVHDDSIARNLREQLVQELAQLGQRTLEAAFAMSKDATDT